MGKGPNENPGGITNFDLNKTLKVYLREPMTPERVEEIFKSWVQNIKSHIAIIQDEDELETFLTQKLGELGDITEKLTQSTLLINDKEGELIRIQTAIQEANGEIRLLDSKMLLKSKKLDRIFFNKAGKLINTIRENIVGIVATIGIGGLGVGGSLATFNYFTTSPEEQILINEQTQKVRSALEATFSRLGITIDEAYEIAGIKLRRSREGTAFSERDFLIETNFYQLEGEYQGYKLFLAIAFSAPENVIVGLGEVKTELTTPTVSDIETFISEEFQRQEVLRIEKEREENEQNTILALPENQAIIAEKKEGVRSVIARLSGNENITLSEPFQMKVPLRNIDFYNFEMTPDFGTGNLSDGDYLRKGSEFSITSSKLTFDIDDLSFQIKITISTDAPYNINLISIDSSGSKGPNDLGSAIRNFNGQDVSVFLKELERYFMQE